MVARPGLQFLSWNSGELAPEFHARRDVKNFHSGFAAGRNMEANPLGGGRQSPRTRYKGRGGRLVTTGVNATVGATGSISSGTVVATADLGADGALCGADISFTGVSAVADGLRVELQDSGGTWAAISATIDVAASARAYRICIAPGAPVTGRRARLVAAATINLSAASVTVLTETATTAGRLLTHTFSTSEAYALTVAAGHADIWKAGTFVGAVAIPHTAGQLATLQKTQRGASMLLWHKDVAPHEVRRDGADHQWTQATRTWLAIPEVDYGGTYVDTAEKWNVYVTWTTDGGFTIVGQSIVVTVNGEDTSPVEVPTTGFSADWPAFASALETALEALAALETGITCAVVGTPSSTAATISIEFTGTGNAGAQFVVTAKVATNSDKAAANVGRTVRGRAGGEAVMSVTRGWPRTGIYAEDRLFMGGFASRGDAYLGSRTGEYFDLNAELETAASAFVFGLNADGAEDILRFHRGPHFIIFTNERHYYVANPPFNRQQPPNQRVSETPGIQPNCEPVEIEGRIIYVGNDGSQLLAAQYSDVTQKYDTSPISLLANHLVRGIVSTALQRASSDTVANRLFMVRDDGDMTLGGIVRNQDVTGFWPWQTDGDVLDVAVDGTGAAWLLVKRPIGEGEALTFEQLTLDTQLDCTVTVSQAESVTVAGLGVHEGREVWAKAGGTYAGPFTVTGGAITLPWTAAAIEVGRWIAPRLKVLPIQRELNEKSVVVRPGRIHTAKITANAVSSLAIAANGQPAFDVPLASGDDDAEGPWDPVTGLITVTGFAGWQVGAQLELTQLRPGAFDIRDITLEGRF